MGVVECYVKQWWVLNFEKSVILVKIVLIGTVFVLFQSAVKCSISDACIKEMLFMFLRRYASTITYVRFISLY